jgi:superfamily I DNA/RNA helicase
LEGLNEDQMKAYRKSVLEERFCLVEGMPGTGKTELIIRLILKFSTMKKNVLITTFTNRALDNIL